MTATIPAKVASSEVIYYPDGDGKPMAESDLHRDEMVNCLDSLQSFFSGRNDVYVAGNNFLYYRQGIPRLFVSPDCYVVFGIGPQPRKSYKVWEEQGVLPSVVIEITSESTRDDDLERKYNLYQDVLLIPEYIMFDPNADYVGTRLTVLRLTVQGYEPVLPDSHGRLHSEQLGLDLFVQGNHLRFFDPARGEVLPTSQEVRRLAIQETQRANEEAQARAEAEAENVRLRAELEALRNARA